MSLLCPQPRFASMTISARTRRGSAGRLLLACAALLVAATCAVAADPPTIPLDQIKPGMAGVGYTIFAGDQIEKFDLEVLGILPNLIGPRQSIILVQLKGPHVEHTGVVAGMSGSPVYIDGKLAGRAVAEIRPVQQGAAGGRDADSGHSLDADRRRAAAGNQGG